MEELAQQAYFAYCDAVGWRDPQGLVMPDWNKLTSSQKAGWANAAGAVAELAFADPTKVKVEVDAYMPAFKTST